MEMVMEVDEEGFNLERRVCNHGFFMMSPNRWVPSSKTLTRPFRLWNNSPITLSITQPSATHSSLILLIHNHSSLSPRNQQAIRAQVSRMLRISPQDERAANEFYTIHPQARESGFGRIFRSPSLFEDIVKSLLLCQCSWQRSLEMAEALCSLQCSMCHCQKSGLSSKRKRCCCNDESIIPNFPCPKDIANLDEETLNAHCKLGYRASIIIRVAQDFVNRRLRPRDFERANVCDYKSAHARFTKIKGFGPFSVANVMMCLGFYKDIPVDTETIKHLKQVHKKTHIDEKNQAKIVEEVYGKYAPYQCLAYWMERVEYYEKMLGKLSELPQSQYCNVSTVKINNIVDK